MEVFDVEVVRDLDVDVENVDSAGNIKQVGKKRVQGNGNYVLDVVDDLDVVVADFIISKYIHLSNVLLTWFGSRRFGSC